MANARPGVPSTELHPFPVVRRKRLICVGSAASALTAIATLWPAGPTALGAPAAPSAGTVCSPVGVVATPSRGLYDGLYGVSALNNNDVWAVGRYIGANSADETLVEHWNGDRFRQVPSPDPQHNDVLLHVQVVSATDVWAVGKTWPATVEVFSPLIEHFDGRTWSAVPTPALHSGSGLLAGVAATSPDDVWAVGSQFSGPADGMAATLAEHWDGTAWQVMSSPDPGRYGNYLDSVTVVSPRDVWAVGTSYTTAHGTANLIEHWNGTQWQVAAEPYRPGNANYLYAISASTAPGAWAAGSFAGNQTLALHLCKPEPRPSRQVPQEPEPRLEGTQWRRQGGRLG